MGQIGIMTRELDRNLDGATFKKSAILASKGASRGAQNRSAKGVSANTTRQEMSARGAGSKPLGFGANREGGTLHPARLGVPVLAPLLVEITVGGEVGSDQNTGGF